MRLAVAGIAMMLVPALAKAQAVPQPYAANCQMCHQTGAKGVPGVYPRLAGRVPVIAASAEGRRYLIQVLLHGQVGRIIVDGRPLSGAMVSYARLSDTQLADVLNYLVRADGKGKARPFVPAEIATARALPKVSAVDMGKVRARLVTAGLIP